MINSFELRYWYFFPFWCVRVCVCVRENVCRLASSIQYTEHVSNSPLPSSIVLIIFVVFAHATVVFLQSEFKTMKYKRTTQKYYMDGLDDEWTLGMSIQGKQR